MTSSISIYDHFGILVTGYSDLHCQIEAKKNSAVLIVKEIARNFCFIAKKETTTSRQQFLKRLWIQTND